MPLMQFVVVVVVESLINFYYLNVEENAQHSFKMSFVISINIFFSYEKQPKLVYFFLVFSFNT